MSDNEFTIDRQFLADVVHGMAEPDDLVAWLRSNRVLDFAEFVVVVTGDDREDES